MSRKGVSHAPPHSHVQAPNLGPCGLPPGERHNPEFNSEVEKHLSEKLTPNLHTEREKLLRAEKQTRLIF